MTQTRWNLLALALLGLLPMQARAQTPAAQEVFSVVLSTSAGVVAQPRLDLPLDLRGTPVYWRKISKDGAVAYQLCLGFYGTRKEADQARQRLATSFKEARVIPVSVRERDDVLKTLVTRSSAAAEPGAGGDEAGLMAEGRHAIIRERYPAAIRAFRQILAMPENAQTRDALEFLALAYERSGDIARARAEYENYLKRYPEGDDALRVRQRLGELRPAPQAAAPLRTSTRSKDGWRTMTFGSLSQFYYRGNSKVDNQTLQPTTNTFDRTTLSLTDQSALITNVDLNARYLSDTHDNRLVFRDTNTQNFVEGQNDLNRLTAAYYEYKYKPADFSARVGRQPGNSGGLLGRFDGALVGYGLSPRMRLNVVAGEPVEHGLSFDSRRRFYGISTDLGPFDQRWSGNLYFIQQTADSVIDRRAVGTEMRYLVPQGHAALLVDYDTVFHAANIVMLQGNWQAPSKTSFNLFLDRRKTPNLQISTATFGEATTSIQTLLASYMTSELRRRAMALTATASSASISLTHPVNRVWQVGADYRVMRISATEGTNNFPAMPDSGSVHTLSAQATGTGVFGQRDVTVVSLSRVQSDTYRGLAYSLIERAPIGANWLLGTSLLLYNQDNSNGSTMRRLNGTLRAEYRWRRDVTFEAEFGLEETRSKGAFADEKIGRRFASIGYRWDF